MKYSHFLTPISSARKPSPIRETVKLLVNAPPELVYLGAGMPNDNFFPFKSATFNLPNGKKLELNSDVMKSALQYGPSLGYPPLVEKLKSYTLNLHKPPNWNNTDLLVTAGGQYGLSTAIEMLVNPGDYFVTQEPIYPGTLGIVDPLTPKYLTVDVDEHGMKPDILKKKLEDEHKNITDKKIPKVLYVNPTAGNPTGISLTFERKKDIYKIACDHNLIILEDDPYYFVQFDEKPTPTFLSLDVEGRVLRFDSFSKIMSSGIRLGYVTGPKELVSRMCFHSQTSILHAPGMAQAMVSELLHQWGDETFFAHIAEIRQFYKQQRDLMLRAAEKHLADLCTWNIPTGGMFLWLKVTALKDTTAMIVERGLKNNVVLIPGQAFLCDGKAESQFLRASFSLATADEMDKGFQYLAKMIKEEVVLQDKN